MHCRREVHSKCIYTQGGVAGWGFGQFRHLVEVTKIAYGVFFHNIGTMIQLSRNGHVSVTVFHGKQHLLFVMDYQMATEL